MCSICPRCNPPVSSEPSEAISFEPLQPILPAPSTFEPTDEEWEKIRRWEFPIGGLICSCPPETK